MSIPTGFVKYYRWEYISKMKKIDNRKKPLTPELLAECQKLKELFDSKKKELNISQGSIADEMGINQSSVSHYLNGVNALNAPAAAVFARTLKINVSDFSPRLAKELNALAKSVTKSDNVTMINNLIEKEKKQKKDKVIDIPLFDIEASMGKGCVPLDFPQAVINISVDKNFFISRSIPITSNENLAIISGIGDSMEPTFSSGDPIIIDRGITTFKEEGIYIFTLYNELYIKRLQKLPNCLKMISDNKKYEPYDLRGEDLENIIIHGKVLFAWNGKKI